MTPADKGRFCGSCQKNVVDFTRSSDREIASVLTTGENVCGRFRSDQLERELFVPTRKKSFWAAASAAALSFLALGTNEALAQGGTQIENASKIPDPPVVGDTIVVHKKYRITGTLKDSSGAPAPHVEILLETRPGRVITDAEGKFVIDVRERDEVIMDIPGNTFVEMDVNPSLPKTIKVRTRQARRYETTGVIVTVEEKIENRRTFFGRIFHLIGNLFR